MNESGFWRSIKKKLPGEVDRIENLVSSGMPDCNGTYSSVDYWIELKVCRTKKLQSPFVLCSPIQKEWHRKRRKQGACIFVLTKHKKDTHIYKVHIVKNRAAYIELKIRLEDLIWYM